MGCRFTIYSLFMDIQNSFLDIHNSFLDIQMLRRLELPVLQWRVEIFYTSGADQIFIAKDDLVDPRSVRYELIDYW